MEGCLLRVTDYFNGIEYVIPYSLVDSVCSHKVNGIRNGSEISYDKGVVVVNEDPEEIWNMVNVYIECSQDVWKLLSEGIRRRNAKQHSKTDRG